MGTVYRLKHQRLPHTCAALKVLKGGVTELAAAAVEQVIDPAALGELRAFFGEEESAEIIGKLVESFHIRAPEMIRGMREAFDQGNGDQVAFVQRASASKAVIDPVERLTMG